MASTLLPTARLGATDLRISRVGFGAFAIGGPDYQFGWGPQDDSDSIGAIHAALDAGVNWIDTAPMYGFGHSETVIGRALDGLDARERPYVFTKCSLVEGPDRTVEHDLSRDSILREAEASLRRLRTDAIDLYQIHWPIPQAEIEGAWATLVELKEQGAVRHIGVSNFSVEQLQRLHDIAPVETLQCEYSIVERHTETAILPYAERADLGVITYSPMVSGLLSGSMTRERVAAFEADGDWRKDDPRFHEPQLEQHLALVERLDAIADRHGVDAGAVAIAWVLRHSAVTGAIVGFRRPSQISALLEAAQLELSDDEARDIESAKVTSIRELLPPEAFEG